MQTTLTHEQKAAVARIITGAVSRYQIAIANAISEEERAFYVAQLAEAEQLGPLFSARQDVAINDDDQDGEEEDEDEP